MPVPAGAQDRGAGPRTATGQPAPSPVATPDLWDLSASPATLRSLADAWRAVRDGAAAAEESAHRAAVRVLRGGLWVGATADSYDRHRVKVNRDLADLADRAGRVADALEELAGMLETNQDLLRQERERLADVPATYEPELTFRPVDAEQARRVTAAITAATEIRTHVDEQMSAKRHLFAAEQATLDAIAEAWRPRTLRMVNLNIGSGNDRWPRGKAGVDPGEVDELAGLIAGQDADVVTLQEVFGEDLATLEEQLEARTGARWEVRFEEASRKDRWTSWGDIRLDRPFGNAVLVRTGDVIDGVGASEQLELAVDREWEEPPTIPSPGVPPGPDSPQPDGGIPVADGEGRAATGVKIRLTPR